MPLLSNPSPATRTALSYITVGSLTVVWTGIWYVFLYNNPPEPDSTAYYWCTGFLVTGLALLCIGLGLGRIGRAAQRAELIRIEATSPAATTDAHVGERNSSGAEVVPAVAPAAALAGTPLVSARPSVPVTSGAPNRR
jgi:hypothetical protein